MTSKPLFGKRKGIFLLKGEFKDPVAEHEAGQDYVFRLYLSLKDPPFNM
jgi:hypothetical protein